MIALMIDCDSIEVYKIIFQLTCFVGIQPNNNTRLLKPITNLWTYEKISTVRQVNETLSLRIRDRKIDLETMTESADVTGKKRHIPDIFEEKAEDHIGETAKWVQALLLEVTNDVVLNNDCMDYNPCYCPSFIEKLQKIAKEFPLWTGVMNDLGWGHSTSSYVEGYFSELKSHLTKSISIS